MIKTLLLNSLLLIGMISNAQIIQENFEGETYLFENNNSTVDWLLEENKGHNSSKSFRNTYTSRNENVLELSTALDLSSTNSPELSFWHIAKTEGNYDKSYVEISVDGGLTYSNLASNYIVSGTNYPGAKDYFDETIYSTWYAGDLEWEKAVYDLSAYKVENVKIRFKLISDSSAEREGWFIDDIIVRDISCPEIKSAMSSNITTNTATIQWEHDASSFEIEYGILGFSKGQGNVLTTNANSIDISNLNTSSTYEYYLRALCDTEDQSDWSDAFNFSTLCGTSETINESFDNLDNGTIPNCFLAINNSPNNYTEINVIEQTNYLPSYEGAKMFIFYNSQDIQNYFYLVSPELSNLNQASHRLNFYARATNSQVVLEIGTMSAQGQEDTFSLVTTITPSTQYSTYGEVLAEIPATTDTFIAIRMKSTMANQSLFIDNLKWEEIPSCKKIQNLNLDYTGQDTASLNWEGDATQYEIQYGLKGFTLGQGTVINSYSSNIILNNLESSTQYDIYVKSICGEDESTYSPKINVQTACGVISELPWNEGFENMLSLGGNMPDCMSKNSPNTLTYGVDQDYNRIPRTGDNYLTIRYNTDEWIKTPPLLLEQGQTYEFSFWAITDGKSPFAIDMKYGQNSTSLNMNLMNDIIFKGTEYTQMKGEITPNETGVYFIGIHVQSGQDPWYMSIDDLQLSEKTLAVNQNVIQDNMRIYPNPVQEYLNIDAKENIKSIAVYNIFGQLEKTYDNQTKVNLSSLPKGIYFVYILQDNGQTKVRKIIKE